MLILTRDDDRNVPLYTTIELNRYEMAEYMLDYGANISVINDAGWSVLVYLLSPRSGSC